MRKGASFKVWNFPRRFVLKTDVIFSIKIIKKLQKSYFTNEIFKLLTISLFNITKVTYLSASLLPVKECNTV